MFKPETSTLASTKWFLFPEASISDSKTQILFHQKPQWNFNCLQQTWIKDPTCVKLRGRNYLCIQQDLSLWTHMSTMFYFPCSNVWTCVVHRLQCTGWSSPHGQVQPCWCSSGREQGLSLLPAFGQIRQIMEEFQEKSRKQQGFHIKSSLELEWFGSMPSMAVEQMTQCPCLHSLF